MARKVLTQFAAGEVRRMRAEVDEWGDPLWTGLEISIKLGISESTVWRVLNKQAAYAKMGLVEKGGLTMEMAHAALVLNPATGIDEAAKASEAAMLKFMRDGAMPVVKAPSGGTDQLTPAARARLSLFQDVPERPEVETPTKRVMVPSPLDEE